jgi:hypothetical protein
MARVADAPDVLDVLAGLVCPVLNQFMDKFMVDRTELPPLLRTPVLR